jgi:hypothetical protein
MSTDNQPATRIRCGRLTEFLRRNYFRVELDDGQEIIAVMPEALFHVYNPNVPLRRFSASQVHVKVLMRRPPKMPVIVQAHRAALLGATWEIYDSDEL